MTYYNCKRAGDISDHVIACDGIPDWARRMVINALVSLYNNAVPVQISDLRANKGFPFAKRNCVSFTLHIAGKVKSMELIYKGGAYAIQSRA